jgi:hypothetical protein
MIGKYKHHAKTDESAHARHTYMKILKALLHASPHIGRFLLLFVVLAYESRGVELQLCGFNIEHLLPLNLPNPEAVVPACCGFLPSQQRS